MNKITKNSKLYLNIFLYKEFVTQLMNFIYYYKKFHTPLKGAHATDRELMFYINDTLIMLLCTVEHYYQRVILV